MELTKLSEVDAWDNADFRAAVKATGKQQIILAGITTDVCTYPILVSFFLAIAYVSTRHRFSLSFSPR